MKTISLPPAASTLMWSIRSIGYTTPSAVADIIDNSISANATTISIEYEMGSSWYFSIFDNGDGMTSEELIMAMQVGSGNPFEERATSDLGRFGLGLKTASLSQCKVLTVISKKNGLINGFRWDLNHIYEVNKWELLELDDDELRSVPQYEKLKKCPEGTIVLWNDLDKMCAGASDQKQAFLETIREVEEHLSLTFHRYLQGEPGLNKITIVCNGVELEPMDPFFVSRSDVMPEERIAVDYVSKNGENKRTNVVVTPYILPFSDSISQNELDKLGGKEGLIKNQGFYVYRNKRLIVAADWFRVARKTDLSKLCRVKVDIPNTLDDLWTIDVKKSMAIPPEVVLKNMRRIVKQVLQTGKKKYRFRATSEKKKDAGAPLWIAGETRNGIIYTINKEYPLLVELMKDTSDKQKFNTFLKLVEQNIPVNAIHTDFYDDKKFAFEDVDEAYQNVKTNLIELLTNTPIEKRKECFSELMQMKPFSEYDISFEDLGVESK